jgi:hypothetical protein
MNGMADTSGFPLTNALLYGVVVLAPPALFYLALRIPVLIRRVRRARQPAPKRPPIQDLAADLRRVHRLLTEFGPGTPMARRLGTRQAYDALLIEACEAVEVEHQLQKLPEGIDREIERLRLEESLRSAGLAIP